MKIEDEDAALQAIRDNAQDKERIQMISLLKGLLPDKRKDLWHGLTPEDLVGVLRSLLESGGLGHVFTSAEEPLCHPWVVLITCAHFHARELGCSKQHRVPQHPNAPPFVLHLPPCTLHSPLTCVPCLILNLTRNLI